MSQSCVSCLTGGRAEGAEFLVVGVLVDACSSSTLRLIAFVRRFLVLGGAIASSRLHLVPAGRFGVDVVAFARFGPAMSRSGATNQGIESIDMEVE